jgi:3-hydroxyacyl-[acyl-carrier-protein] dehydratase
MEFNQLEKILEIKRDSHIICSRRLEGSERYLIDHFPSFKVMPGVLMLEALTQAAGWLLRGSCNFESPIVEVREVKNFKFQDFVQPGMELVSRVDLFKRDGDLATVKAAGFVDGRAAVSGRLVLDCFKMVERRPEQGFLDATTRAEHWPLFQTLLKHATLVEL